MLHIYNIVKILLAPIVINVPDPIAYLIDGSVMECGIALLGKMKQTVRHLCVKECFYVSP